MFKRILVPIDGSPLGERILPYATRLAGMSKGQLVLFGGLMGGAASSELPSILESIAGRLREAGHGTEVVVRSCNAGHVGAAIVEAAHVQGADLIAMESRGRDEIGRLVLGSVTEQVLQRAETPILLATPTCDRRWSAEGPRRLLIALDGSRLAEEALAGARPLARAPGARVTLLSVVDMQGFGYVGALSARPLLEASRVRTMHYLEVIAAGERDVQASLETVVETGVPAERIASTARTREADLIVMATRGRGGFGRLLVGSVALAVAHESRVPLLLVRPVRAVGESGAHTIAHDATQRDAVGDLVGLALSRRELRLLETALERLHVGTDGVDATPNEVEGLLARLRRAAER